MNLLGILELTLKKLLNAPFSRHIENILLIEKWIFLEALFRVMTDEKEKYRKNKTDIELLS